MCVWSIALCCMLCCSEQTTNSFFAHAKTQAYQIPQHQTGARELQNSERTSPIKNLSHKREKIKQKW